MGLESQETRGGEGTSKGWRRESVGCGGTSMGSSTVIYTGLGTREFTACMIRELMGRIRKSSEKDQEVEVFENLV